MSDRYLLIWEENPYEIKFYDLPAIEVESERFALEHAHGVMVNGGENDEYACEINGFISRGGTYGHETFLPGKWAEFQIEVSELPKRSFAGVFKTGFYA